MKMAIHIWVATAIIPYTDDVSGLIWLLMVKKKVHRERKASAEDSLFNLKWINQVLQICLSLQGRERA